MFIKYNKATKILSAIESRIRNKEMKERAGRVKLYLYNASGFLNDNNLRGNEIEVNDEYKFENDCYKYLCLKVRNKSKFDISDSDLNEVVKMINHSIKDFLILNGYEEIQRYNKRI